MQKNTSGQKLMVYAWDSTTGLPKTGDAANLTAYRALDWGTVTVLTDTSATEMDATNAKGFYLFDLAQAETNANVALYTAKSSTANIVVMMARGETMVPPNFSATGIDSSGNVTSNLIQRQGTADTPRITGTAVSSGGQNNTIQLPATITAVQCEIGDWIRLANGQTRRVTAYNTANQIATVHAFWLINPDNTTGFEIFKDGGVELATPIDILNAFPLSANGNVKSDLVESCGVVAQLNGSGTQNIGGP